MQPLPCVAGIVAEDQELLINVIDPLLERLREHARARAEVMLERADGDACLLGDVLEARARVAAPRDHARRRREQLGTPLIGDVGDVSTGGHSRRRHARSVTAPADEVKRHAKKSR